MAYPRNCCSITSHITSSSDCAQAQGGAKNLLISCLKDVTFVEIGCAGGTYVVDPLGSAIDYVVPANDAQVVELDGTFYSIDARDKTLEHVWSMIYDPDTNQKTYSESINLDVDVKDNSFYCVIEEYIGQEVALLFQEKGTDRWYIVGRDGGISVNEMSGGTGTEEFTPTSFVIGGENTDTIFRRVIIMIEDPENAGQLIDDTTAQIEALKAA